MWMAIVGICGRMGEKMYEFYKNTYSIVGVDLKQKEHVKTYSHINDVEEPLDVVIDFSSTACMPLLETAILKKIPVLSGTTGYTSEQIGYLCDLAVEQQTKFFWSANYAKGIQLFSRLVEECDKEFEIFDFVEIHATTKKDKPSGTAKMLADKLGIPEDKIQSLRLFQAPAIHELIFSSEDERVIIRHEVIDKRAFIVGFNEQLQKMLGDVGNAGEIV